MEAWLAQELEQRRQSRRLAALARETGINPQRLQRLARGESDPDAPEMAALSAVLRPAPKAAPPPPAATPTVPKPVSSLSARPAPVPAVSSDLGRLTVPEQGATADFLHRQKLIQFARQIRDWPQKHTALRPGDMARLQTLWNETQTAIAAINTRIWGTPEGPGTPAGLSEGKKRKTHHSLRFLFKQAAEEKLPKTEIDELSRIARDAMTQGAAKGFLDAFVKAAKAVLDEDDFKILLDKTMASAGPGATPETLLADLDEEEGGEDKDDDKEGAGEDGRDGNPAPAGA